LPDNLVVRNLQYHVSYLHHNPTKSIVHIDSWYAANCGETNSYEGLQIFVLNTFEFKKKGIFCRTSFNIKRRATPEVN